MSVSARRVLKFVETLDGTEAAVMVLYHMTVSQRLIQVSKYENWESANDIAAVIWETSVNYAGGMGGTQSFILRAFAKDDREFMNSLTSTAWKATPPPTANENDAAGSEPPNMDGLVAQLMRQNETLFRNFNAMSGASLHHLVRMVEVLEVRLNEAQQFKIEAMSTMEALQTKKHMRDMETKQIEAKVERDKEIFGRITAYLPVAINHLAGKEIIRQKNSEMELTTMEFVRQLTMPQLDKIRDMGVLKPEQVVLLATMVQKAAEQMAPADQIKQESEAARAIAAGGAP